MNDGNLIECTEVWRCEDVGASLSPGHLGLSLSEGKTICAALQQAVAKHQVACLAATRMSCSRCGAAMRVKDYRRRRIDAAKWSSPALFLAAATYGGDDGRLNVRSLNYLWNAVARTAGVTGKTPHAARHAMGKRIMQRTGNVAAVQRQLGHKNAAYSLQYARITDDELQAVVDRR